jgi:diaminopimelate decarboxylase
MSALNDFFHYKSELLFAEHVSLEQLSQEHGTPCYVYSRAALENHWQTLDNAFASHPHLICYAVKANSNIAVLNVLAKLGSGFDIVSVGELERVLLAKGDPKKVVFSGLAKQAHEITRALEVGIRCFNIESESEIALINECAQKLNVVAPVSVRVNPDVDPQTHPYISTGLKENKFGLPFTEAKRIYQSIQNADYLEAVGVDCHIGSQLTSLSPFMDALDLMLKLIDELEYIGVSIQHFDFGGGLGVCYKDEQAPSANDYAQAILKKIGDRKFEILLEPGRSIAANAGVFLTQVQFLKSNEDKNFAVVDGAMNDLIRPALYQAWQDIVPVNKSANSNSPVNTDVVGPVCESGDFLGKDRKLAIQSGDVLAVCSAGAYGFVMSSNYNSRNRPPEIMVDGDKHYVIRQRETYENQFQLESVLPE